MIENYAYYCYMTYKMYTYYKTLYNIKYYTLKSYNYFFQKRIKADNPYDEWIYIIDD